MIARETIANKREKITSAPKSALDEKEEIKYHFLSEIERRKKLGKNCMVEMAMRYKITIYIVIQNFK